MNRILVGRALYLIALTLIGVALGLSISAAPAATASTEKAEGSARSTLLVSDFNTTLEPGVWHGFVVGASSLSRGYVVEISPLQPSIGGAHVERYVVQPEFDGTQWNDILRAQIPSDNPPLKVSIRVYAVTR